MASLRNDGVAQGRCMINATVLGQLGIEYLDDRRQEYQYLEKIVKADLASRKKDIAVVQQNVEAFTDNLKNLIRTDVSVFSYSSRLVINFGGNTGIYDISHLRVFGNDM